MQDFLTKQNIKIMAIVIVSASLFVAWGVYLTRDTDTPVTPPVATSTVATSTFPAQIDTENNIESIVALDTPQKYWEVFKTPINPNTEPEKNMAIYKKIADRVSINTYYLTRIPEGFYITEIMTTITYVNLPKSDFYSVKYANPITQETITLEGLGKVAFSEEELSAEINLGGNKRALYIAGYDGLDEIYVYPSEERENDGSYRIISTRNEKAELVETAQYVEAL